MKIEIPLNVKSIIDILEQNGYEAYIVGGCVRDSILGITPKDWDITTNAKPPYIKEIFDHTVDTGIKHGTVSVVIDKKPYEVTTYRIDGEYLDARHPNKVSYTSNLKEDLLRRDFTINAMAYNEKSGLIDEYDGFLDLKNKIIKCVGNPYERFKEDALRMLRAIRFSARFDFSIEENTKNAVKSLAPTLSKISMERIREEFVNILISNHPEKLKELHDLGLLQIFFPEWDDMINTEQNSPHHVYSAAEHTIHALKSIENTKVLRLAALFHDIGKPYVKTTDKNGIDHFKGHEEKGACIAKKIMRRLKFDNDTIKKVTTLVKYHYIRPKNKAEFRRIMSKTGLFIYPDIFSLNKADIEAQSDYKREEKLKRLSEVKKMYEEICEDKDPLFIKDLSIGGDDLKQIGIHEGKDMGRVLNALINEAIDDPTINKKDLLIKEAKRIYGDMNEEN